MYSSNSCRKTIPAHGKKRRMPSIPDGMGNLQEPEEYQLRWMRKGGERRVDYGLPVVVKRNRDWRQDERDARVRKKEKKLLKKKAKVSEGVRLGYTELVNMTDLGGYIRNLYKTTDKRMGGECAIKSNLVGSCACNSDYLHPKGCSYYMVIWARKDSVKNRSVMHELVFGEDYVFDASGRQIAAG